MPNPIVEYYKTLESKWGYRFMLKGVKHFGYYPLGQESISIKRAQKLMNDQVGEALKLPPGSTILDAGSGEGSVANYLAQKFNWKITGVELLDFNVKRAVQSARHQKSDVQFINGDYSDLSLPDQTFDGIYTLETLVHSPNYRQTLAEFARIFKPNGKLVLFEYSMPAKKDLTPKQLWAFETINRGAAMPAFNEFINGTFEEKLLAAGFKDVQVRDISDRMHPMLKKLARRASLPYQVIKLLHQEDRYINAMSAVELYRYRHLWRYNIVSAIRSG